MFKHILVPTDGSPLSRRAIQQAVRFAKEQKARVTGLYVAPPYKPGVIEDASMLNFVSPRQYEERTRTIARGHLKVIETAAASAGVRCETLHALSDFPYDEIVRAARRRKCDLIYMASHGRRGISRLLLGSQTSKVLALSTIPVIVCR
jgi:nucleotide-binding universal stress UspA family protein